MKTRMLERNKCCWKWLFPVSFVVRDRTAFGDRRRRPVERPSDETLRAYFAGVATRQQWDEIHEALLNSRKFREEFARMADEQTPAAGSTRTISGSGANRLLITEQLIPQLEGGVLLRLDGHIGHSCDGPLEEAVDRQIERHCIRLVVDFSGVTFVCTAGWGVFLGRLKEIRRAGGDIKFAAMRPDTLEVFANILQCGRILEHRATVEDAIGAFADERE
jgi:anti-anti-sigma factor